MSENRNQNRQIKFRLDEVEFEHYLKQLKASGMTQQKYLSACALKKKIIIIPGYHEVALQLKKIGTNINQLAHRANEGYPISNEEIQIVQEELMQIWQLLKQCGRTAAQKR